MRKPAPKKPKEKAKEKPRYLAEVPKPDDDALMEIFYGGVSGRPDKGPPPVSARADKPGSSVFIPLDKIAPDLNQPRKTFDQAKLDELAESIKVDGLVQPIAVRPDGDKFIIVAGERRWRAHQMLGRTEIEAKVFDLTPMQAFRLALVENVQRDSLLPLEEARAYQKLINESGISQAELARQLGIDRRRVSEKVTLTRLPAALQQLLSARADTFGERHALLLASATAAQGLDIVAIGVRCAKEGWSLARLRSALAVSGLESPEPKLFQNLHVAMNRRGGFTLMVRARSRDEVATTITELERTVESLRASFELSARADKSGGAQAVEGGAATRS
jgi:ParB family chromosome partitioning protein